MNDTEKNILLNKSEDFFSQNIIASHINNIAKLSYKSFNINPFTLPYLSTLTYGDTDPYNLARVLILPRILGTSISTTFGTAMQKYCNEVLDGFGSTTQGIDIEFLDALDGRKKYCQMKSGPNTINFNDIETIENHFKAAKNFALVANHMVFRISNKSGGFVGQ